MPLDGSLPVSEDVRAFRDWVAKQRGPYQYISYANCAVAQYLKDRGICRHTAYIGCTIDELARGPGDSVGHASLYWTYEQLLERCNKYLGA